MRSVAWGVAILLAAAILPGGSAAAPIRPNVRVPPKTDGLDRPREVLDAIAAFREGKPDVALKILQGAAPKYPFLPPPRLMIANLYFTNDQPAAGKATLEKLVLEAPDDPEAYLIFADFLLVERRVAEASVLLEKAAPLLAKFDRDATRKRHLENRLLQGLASVAEGQENWPAAERALTRLTERAPNDARHWSRLGAASFHLQKYAPAREQLTKANQLAPDLPPAEVALGLLFDRTGDREQAAKLMAAALQRAPRNARVWTLVAQWHWDGTQADLAKERVDQALTWDAKHLPARRLRGQIALGERDFARAEELFEAALVEAAGDFVIADQLAIALGEQPSVAKQRRGLELAQLNARKAPQHNDAIITLAWVNARMGNAQAADQILRNIDKSRPMSRDSAYRAARLVSVRGNADTVLNLLQGALDYTGPFGWIKEAQAWRQELVAKKGK